MSMFDKPILVFQTDFTYAEGAVSSMYGVVKTVDRELEIFDGTHQLPQYDTWSASYRLWRIFRSGSKVQNRNIFEKANPSLQYNNTEVYYGQYRVFSQFCSHQ